MKKKTTISFAIFYVALSRWLAKDLLVTFGDIATAIIAMELELIMIIRAKREAETSKFGHNC